MVDAHEPVPGPAGLPERPPPPLSWRDVVDRALAPEGARVRLAAVAVCVAVVAGAALWALRPPPAPATEATLPFAPGAAASGGGGGVPGGAPTAATRPSPGSPDPQVPPGEVTVDVVVHAAGAVVAPGLHRLAAGSRVADLLAAAGGPTPDADLDRVNLAAPLADGLRVWFPRQGEDPPPVLVGGAPGPPGTSDGGGPAAPAPVDVNAATATELEALPGVGPATAAAIVEHRQRHGRFPSVDALIEVRGIGPAKLEALRDLVTVG